MKPLRYLFWIIFLPLILHAKIYDCFQFFNELELLKMRLEELNDSVDYFVLVESVETQRGTPKPLYFKENKHLYEKYLHKIIHIVVDERHPEMSMWEREHFQRNCILRGLKKCDPSDVIIISDLDEIPRPSALAALKPFLASSTLPSMAIPPNFKKPKQRKNYENKYSRLGAFALQMDNYYYQLNRQTPNGEIWDGGLWYGTIVTTYEKLASKTPQYFRNLRNKLPRIHKGGWHFTWMGGRDKVRQKLVSVVEGRENGHLVSDVEIDQWLEKHPPVPIDDSFPQYVQKNEAYLKSIGFIADYSLKFPCKSNET